MIEFIATSVLVLSSIYSGSTLAATGTNMISTTTAPGASIQEATTSIPTSKELEKEAKAYFKDDPILVDIAGCESHFRQYNSNGNILRGEINKGDVGIMQINEYYHADKAKALGDDLYTAEGNMAYAQYLYDKYGGQPWVSSSKCWNQTSDQVAINK